MQNKNLSNIVLQEKLQLLFDALSEGNFEEAKQILSDSEDLLYFKDSDNRNILHFSILNKRVDVIKFLFENYELTSELIDSKDYADWTALHSASSSGLTEAVEILAPKSNLELRTTSGCTPLHYAASKGHLEIVDLLLSIGSNLNAKDKYGRTALMRAVIANHYNIFEYLLQNYRSEIDLKIVESFTNDSLLHVAVNNQNFEICKSLCIEESSLLALKNTEGKTPLDECQSRDLLRLLKNLTTGKQKPGDE